MTELNLMLEAPEEVQQALINAAEAALSHSGAEGDIVITLVDDEEIHRINLEYRGVDRPTDVISFPANEGEDIIAPPGFLGDIIISLPRAQAQAEEYGHSLKRELSFLAIHGALHLMGYDHMEEAEAREMFAMQEDILKGMGIGRE